MGWWLKRERKHFFISRLFRAADTASANKQSARSCPWLEVALCCGLRPYTFDAWPKRNSSFAAMTNVYPLLSEKCANYIFTNFDSRVLFLFLFLSQLRLGNALFITQDIGRGGRNRSHSFLDAARAGSISHDIWLDSDFLIPELELGSLGFEVLELYSMWESAKFLHLQAA